MEEAQHHVECLSSSPVPRYVYRSWSWPARFEKMGDDWYGSSADNKCTPYLLLGYKLLCYAICQLLRMRDLVRFDTLSRFL